MILTYKSFLSLLVKTPIEKFEKLLDICFGIVKILYYFEHC